ncbi:13506_t:CDS:2 [Gigaspora rosea]|nr:13506_t:CDS:2 [Gigaspora rosea]
MAKLENVNYETVPNYEKPDAHAQSPDNENVLALKNMQPELSLQISSNLIQALLSDITQNVWLKQEEVIVNMDNVTKQPTPSNSSNLPNIEQDLHQSKTAILASDKTLNYRTFKFCKTIGS